MQRIFKYGEIRNISLTPNKEPNILITDRLPTSLYAGVIHFKKSAVFIWPPCTSAAIWGWSLYRLPQILLSYLANRANVAEDKRALNSVASTVRANELYRGDVSLQKSKWRIMAEA